MKHGHVVATRDDGTDHDIVMVMVLTVVMITNQSSLQLVLGPTIASTLARSLAHIV